MFILGESNFTRHYQQDAYESIYQINTNITDYAMVKPKVKIWSWKKMAGGEKFT